MKNTIKKLFKDEDLFNKALTHKSWVNEHPSERRSNERLEFLGDAILEFVVSTKLFRNFTKKEEGYLTALRANLVNTVNLSSVATKLSIGNMIYLSRGEEEGGGRKNKSLLADTMEAIIGALYLDGGIKKASAFIEKHILSELDTKTKEPLKDSKSMLQELVQSKGYPAPKYQVYKENGPDHSKKFGIKVLFANNRFAKAVGMSKSEAAQKAAKEALLKLNQKPLS